GGTEKQAVPLERGQAERGRQDLERRRRLELRRSGSKRLVGLVGPAAFDRGPHDCERGREVPLVPGVPVPLGHVIVTLCVWSKTGGETLRSTRRLSTPSTRRRSQCLPTGARATANVSGGAGGGCAR